MLPLFAGMLLALLAILAVGLGGIFVVRLQQIGGASAWDEVSRQARLMAIALAVGIGVVYFLDLPATLRWLRPIPLPDVIVYLPPSLLGEIGYGVLGGLLGLAITSWRRHHSRNDVILNLGRERGMIWSLVYGLAIFGALEAALLGKAAIDLWIIQGDPPALFVDGIDIALVLIYGVLLMVLARQPVQIRQAGLSTTVRLIPWTKVVTADWEGTSAEPTLRLGVRHWFGLLPHRFAVAAEQVEAVSRCLSSLPAAPNPVPLATPPAWQSTRGSSFLVAIDRRRQQVALLALVAGTVIVGGSMAAVGEVLAQHAAPGVGPGAFRAGGQPAIVALSWENGLLAQRSDHSWHWLLRDQHLEVLAATQRALYVGTDSGHVWRSGDGGLHWRRADTGLPKSLCPLANDSEACWLVSRSSVVVDALIADPHAPDTLYCSTGIPRLLYRTTDGGATWQWLPIASGLPFIETLVVDLHDSRSLWAGTVESGLYHSGDAGRTWSLMHLGIAGVPDNQAWVETIELLPWQRNTVYAQATLKLSASQYRSTWYRSTDGGQHWTSAASPVAPGQELTSLTISSHAPYWAYARVGNGNAYVSTDGQHWRHSQYVDGIIVADPMQPRTAYSVGGNGIMRSTDGGRTWRRYSSGIAQASDGLRTAVFAPSI